MGLVVVVVRILPDNDDFHVGQGGVSGPKAMQCLSKFQSSEQEMGIRVYHE